MSRKCCCGCNCCGRNNCCDCRNRHRNNCCECRNNCCGFGNFNGCGFGNCCGFGNGGFPLIWLYLLGCGGFGNDRY